jgi:hypothetical protein
VETLTKDKKEKDNVLTNFKLLNLKNVFLFISRKFRRTTKVEKDTTTEMGCNLLA